MTMHRTVFTLVAASLLSGAGLPAFAGGTSADDAALCKAALSLKSKEDGVLLKQSLEYVRASDWFAAEGAAAHKAKYDSQLIIYNAAFKAAQEEDDPQFETAVKGCIDYYKSKTVG